MQRAFTFEESISLRLINRYGVNLWVLLASRISAL
jgi:hypothetical protein